MGPCIIMLQPEVMVVDEWHKDGPQDHITVSLCIQNAINKIHLCSLSITYACPYHNPTATMGHLIHTVTSAKGLPTRCHTRCVAFFGYSIGLLQQLSGWLVSDDLGEGHAGCGGPGLVCTSKQPHNTWSAVVRPVGCTVKLSEMPLETAYGRKMNIQFTGNISGGHSCSQHANCTFPQNLRHLWHCAV